MPVETELARFIRSGGQREFVIGLRTGGWRAEFLPVEAKSDRQMAARVADFRDHLHQLDRENREYLASRLIGLSGATDLADMTTEIDAAVEEFSDRLTALRAEAAQTGANDPEHLASRESGLRDAIAGRFVARANEQRQRQFGVSHYIWRTVGDDRVRAGHAAREGRTYAWDDGPGDEHPGQAINCRCVAEPVVEADQDEYAPAGGIGLQRIIFAAETGGMFDAISDAADDILESLASLPGTVADVAGFVSRVALLSAKVATGTATEAERVELQSLKASVDERIDAMRDFLRDAPELAAAFIGYVDAVHENARTTHDAYLRSEATEAELRQAYAERAHLETTLLLNVVPAGVFAGVLKRLDRFPDFRGAGEMAEWLRRVSANLRRNPADRGWATLRNPGIVWGRGILDQGRPWEDHLEAAGQIGDRLPATFKAFDFWDRQTRVATSAKTLDLSAQSYQAKPGRIYGALKRYVDAVDQFKYDKKGSAYVYEAIINYRVIELAIPTVATPEQLMQIQRAVEYATVLEIEMKITRIR